MTPIFLLSLPRSGSTLLQRLLAAHGEIATANEPHVLLPLLYAGRTEPVLAEYGHRVAATAIQDFVERLPAGLEDYRAAVRAFAGALYQRASVRPSRYFLDKTPKYALVARELVQAFPDARVIVLFRSPLAVVGSIVETFGRGSWNVERFRVDLEAGLAELVEVVRSPAARPRVHALRFEDLLAAPGAVLRGTFEHLGLAHDPTVLERFGSVRLEGRVGDPSARRADHAVLRPEVAGHWAPALASPLRKRWCRTYLEWIGGERLRCMGYDLAALQSELAAVPIHAERLAQDVALMPYRYVADRLEGRALHRLLSWPRDRRRYSLG